MLGAGKSGLGAARLAHKLGLQPVVFEQGKAEAFTKILPEFQALSIPVVFGFDACDAFLAQHAAEFRQAIISPGLDASWDLPRRFTEKGIPILGEIEFAWRELPDSVTVGITGTNGKTTTTALLEHMFNALGQSSIACGNYGYALSEVACETHRYEVLALEISSFQLETIQSFRPKVAIWLNFAPDHLDRYPDEKAYFDAKFRIFENQETSDFSVIRAGGGLEGIRSQILTFTTEPHLDADFQWDGEALSFRNHTIAHRDELPFTERHNVENLMAVLGAGYALGNGFAEMIQALKSFKQGEHRCERVATVQGRTYINDSKATNLHALETCLKSQDQPVVLIAGGKEKGLDYTPLRDFIQEKVSHLVLIGEIQNKLKTLFSDLVPCHEASSMEDAVKLASQFSVDSQSVVLSPGTSSFDMYSGYVARGEAFRQAVAKLQSVPPQL